MPRRCKNLLQVANPRCRYVEAPSNIITANGMLVCNTVLKLAA